MNVALLLVALPVLFGGYAYLVYPLLLRIVDTGRRPRIQADAEWELPSITLLIPAYNEAASIGVTIEGVLALDYPADRRQILVVSDASDDGTDEIVRRFADRGVEMLRLPSRGGKTRAENAAVAASRGEIVVTIDASITVPPSSLRPLIAAFADPTVGVASGRDVSVSASASEGNEAEAGYVGFEMRLRALETRIGSIVGASGCFFATRRHLQDADFPAHLSKDFAAPLRARRRGYRSVSVDAALCLVRRTPELRREYHRKVRTMARGLATLWHERDLLDPLRYGSFAWMLWSHKVARWLVFLTVPFAGVALAYLAQISRIAQGLLAVALAGCGVGMLAIRWPAHVPPPAIMSTLGFVVASHAAGFMAWLAAFRGKAAPTWEPTRRTGSA